MLFPLSIKMRFVQVKIITSCSIFAIKPKLSISNNLNRRSLYVWRGSTYPSALTSGSVLLRAILSDASRLNWFNLNFSLRSSSSSGGMTTARPLSPGQWLGLLLTTGKKNNVIRITIYIIFNNYSLKHIFILILFHNTFSFSLFKKCFLGNELYNKEDYTKTDLGTIRRNTWLYNKEFLFQSFD